MATRTAHSRLAATHSLRCENEPGLSRSNVSLRRPCTASSPAEPRQSPAEPGRAPAEPRQSRQRRARCLASSPPRCSTAGSALPLSPGRPLNAPHKPGIGRMQKPGIGRILKPGIGVGRRAFPQALLLPAQPDMPAARPRPAGGREVRTSALVRTRLRCGAVRCGAVRCYRKRAHAPDGGKCGDT